MKVTLLVNIDVASKLTIADARNVLFNYLFAKHHHGIMFVRADDLPLHEPDEEADPLETLRWLNLAWESDPECPEGSCRPFYLSHRLELYRRHARRLMDQGLAYPCFCSRETLREMFKQQKIHGQRPRYDGRCLRLTDKERKERLEAGVPYQLRLKTPEVVSEIDDVLSGRMVFDPQDVADLVIMNYHERPTQALANVVDHHELGITHVVRGARMRAQTPREAFLRAAFQFDSPTYCHLPLILGEDRTLLSERHGDPYVEDYRKKGYLPEAMLNALAAQGLDLGPPEQLYSLGTLARNFRIEKVQNQPTVWRLDHIQTLNRLALDKVKDDALVTMLEPYVREAGYDLAAQGEAWAKAFVAAVRPGLQALSDVKNYVDVFFADRIEPTPKAQKLLKDPAARKIVDAMEEALEDLPEVTRENYRVLLDAGRRQITNRSKAFTLIRAALTGSDVGPEFSQLLPLLGKARIHSRLENARRYIPRGRG